MGFRICCIKKNNDICDRSGKKNSSREKVICGDFDPSRHQGKCSDFLADLWIRIRFVRLFLSIGFVLCLQSKNIWGLKFWCEIRVSKNSFSQSIRSLRSFVLRVWLPSILLFSQLFGILCFQSTGFDKIIGVSHFSIPFSHLLLAFCISIGLQEVECT